MKHVLLLYPQYGLRIVSLAYTAVSITFVGFGSIDQFDHLSSSTTPPKSLISTSKIH